MKMKEEEYNVWLRMVMHCAVIVLDDVGTPSPPPPERLKSLEKKRWEGRMLRSNLMEELNS